jgi:hypothetical protein
MFSRTLISDKGSDKIASHQRIIRIAHHQVIKYLPADNHFPSAKAIIHFEGVNGPDGLASKRAVEDEPHQFISPNSNDDKLIAHIKQHLHNAHTAYRRKNNTRLEFELSWLQHMVVDGLTPAHHQPFKDQLKDLDPRTQEELNSRFKRIFMPGANFRDLFEKNWQRLGPKGLGTNHVLFEFGIDFLIMPLRPRRYKLEISKKEIESAKTGHFLKLYWQAVQDINQLQMFERYEKKGWTTSLATDAREKLIPTAVRMVVLSWIAAVYRGK